MPQLSSNKEDKNFNYQKIRDEIINSCSESDKKTIALFEQGLENNNLTEDFYVAANKSNSRFIRLYYKLDMAIRNKQVESLAENIYSNEQIQEKINKYSIHLPISPLNPYIEEKDIEANLDRFDQQELESIFSGDNILEKEKRLDDFRWNKINNFTSFDFFNIDSILAFLVKGKMVDRWSRLDPEKGKLFFKQLIDEVRGTYNKNKLSYKIDENNG